MSDKWEDNDYSPHALVVAGDILAFGEYAPPEKRGHPKNFSAVPRDIGIPFDSEGWSDRTLDALRALWDLEYSANAIGEYLHKTKNAIIGKAHRLDLPARPSPIQRDSDRTSTTRVRRAVGRTLPALPSESVTGAPIVLDPAAGSRGAWRTPDRMALLTKWWSGYTPSHLLINRMAEMPGPMWSNDAIIGTYAAQHGLKRPDDLRSNHDARELASQIFKEEMEITPLPPPYVAPVLAEKIRTIVQRPVVPRLAAASRPVVPRPAAASRSVNTLHQQMGAHARAASGQRIGVRDEPIPVARARAVEAPKLFRRVVTCCWPIGELGRPDFRFCDEASEAGRPYCEEHVKIAYVRVRDRREDYAQQDRIA